MKPNQNPLPKPATSEGPEDSKPKKLTSSSSDSKNSKSESQVSAVRATATPAQILSALRDQYRAEHPPSLRVPFSSENNIHNARRNAMIGAAIPNSSMLVSPLYSPAIRDEAGNDDLREMVKATVLAVRENKRLERESKEQARREEEVRRQAAAQSPLRPQNSPSFEIEPLNLTDIEMAVSPPDTKRPQTETRYELVNLETMVIKDREGNLQRINRRVQRPVAMPFTPAPLISTHAATEELVIGGEDRKHGIRNPVLGPTPPSARSREPVRRYANQNPTTQPVVYNIPVIDFRNIPVDPNEVLMGIYRQASEQAIRNLRQSAQEINRARATLRASERRYFEAFQRGFAPEGEASPRNSNCCSFLCCVPSSFFGRPRARSAEDRYEDRPARSREANIRRSDTPYPQHRIAASASINLPGQVPQSEGHNEPGATPTPHPSPAGGPTDNKK